MDIARIAARVAAGPAVAARKKPKRKVAKPSRPSADVLRPDTEYSVNVEISLSADFEGASSKSKVLKKFQSELFAAVKEAVATTAKELGLRSTGLVMKPIEVGVAVTDVSGDDEDD